MPWTQLILQRDHASLALLGAALLLWLVLRVWAARLTANLELRQKLRSLSTLLIVLLLPGALLLVWSAEVHQTLLALTTFAVAIVIAFKELLLCLVGGLYRIATSPYDLGDRIEIGGIRGDVVDLGLASTRLLEVGPGRDAQSSTGRMLHLPHSLLLMQPLINATETGFRWHEVTLVPPHGSDVDELTQALLSIANEVHEEHREELDVAVAALKRKVAYRPPPGTPFVFASVGKDGRFELTLRLAVRSRQQRVAEDRIVRALAARFGQGIFAKKASEDSASD